MAEKFDCPHCGGKMSLSYDRKGHKLIVEAIDALDGGGKEKTEEDILAEILGDDDN